MRSALARLSLKRRNKDKNEEQMSIDSWHSGGKADGFAPQVNGARYFSFDELRMYTNDFSESNRIGRGGYGTVYIGYLSNGEVVAIKRESKYSSQGVQEFKNEIEPLSMVHHKNIVSLVGFCIEHGERMLVYEYMSMGSLYDYFNGRISTYLDWNQRMEIALYTARGLAFLHELANPQIIHGDVKPSNILLDANLNAKVTDFALSKLNRDKKEVTTDTIVGTMGYIDPDYFRTGRQSEKCDVYSVGVIMLQLITGRSIYDNMDEEDKHTTLKDKVMTSIDQYDFEYFGLRGIIDPKIISQVRNISLRKFVQLAMACLKESPSDRPFMYEIMKEIDIILQNYRSLQSTTHFYEDFDSGDKGDAIIPPLNCARYFTFEELQTSTDNFSDYFRIESGCFGPMHIGYLTNGEVVAIRRSDENIFRDADEIKLLTRLHHKNIASLVGFCFERGEQILVYEYISKGTLRDNLDGKFDSNLSWKKRLQIALDSARGLAYLHEDANPRIIHRYVKSRNIILDENLNAKVIDFTLSKLIPEKKERDDFSQATRTLVRVDTIVMGTAGYMDPEYLLKSEVSEKSDVFSFGVVMLELITAKESIIREEDKTLTHLVMTAIDQCDQEYFGLKELIDPKILSQARYISLIKFVQLALACLKESSSDRPFMSEVVMEIENILQNYGNGRTSSDRYYEDDGNASDLPKLQRCLTI